MNIQVLSYKIHKGTVVVEDYIAWAQLYLFKDVASPSLNIIATLTLEHNVFEVEAYFKKALEELQLELPAMEPSSRAYIAFLAAEILSEENETKVFQLAHEIFKIVIELQYPEDLIEWYNISEMQDLLTYDKEPLTVTKQDLHEKIKAEARRVLATTK